MSINIPTITYSKDDMRESETVDEDFFSGGQNEVRWADVDSLSDTEAITQLCKGLGVHSLIVEDILNPRQMVKMDCYDDCLFLVLKMLRYNPVSLNVEAEHVGIILKSGCVASSGKRHGHLCACAPRHT